MIRRQALAGKAMPVVVASVELGGLILDQAIDCHDVSPLRTQSGYRDEHICFDPNFTTRTITDMSGAPKLTLTQRKRTTCRPPSAPTAISHQPCDGCHPPTSHWLLWAANQPRFLTRSI